MGKIMVIIDGMGDSPDFFPRELMQMGRAGAYGTLLTRPASHPADSLPCIATLLGVPACQIPRGRAGVEALSRGLDLTGKLAFRCNLVTCDGDGRILSSCGAGLSPREKAEAFRRAAPLFAARGMSLFYLGDYRGLILTEGTRRELCSLRTSAPHAHLGEDWKSLLPRGTALGKTLSLIARESARVLGKAALLPWDGAGAPALPAFASLHGLTGAAVCAADVVRGLVRGMGMDLPDVPGATGDIDTDLRAKARAALDAAKDHDFVLLHLGGADEAAHRKDGQAKRSFLCRVGKEVIAPLVRREDLELLVCGDHSTLWRTGSHVSFPQPFFLRKRDVGGNLGIRGGRDAVRLLCGEGGNG
ncbi:hypothetical protein [Zongyangia hominis]|uniref:Metalloenzyme domain-containing protein n=1 Tax=Zongyangia hominis TaxID=2763677 RepID=A0A926EBQ4_9FIRM|nr:hypothetical protein [Zongyangia hominis]MBC8569304.1 hypothetical protein [Zongyangia hominis]